MHQVWSSQVPQKGTYGTIPSQAAILSTKNLRDSIEYNSRILNAIWLKFGVLLKDIQLCLSTCFYLHWIFIYDKINFLVRENLKLFVPTFRGG